MDIVGDILWGGGKFHSIDCGAVVVKTTTLPSPTHTHTHTHTQSRTTEVHFEFRPDTHYTSTILLLWH